ncbi:hypothetical protein TNCV_4318371 [Trichonephila clavipes]|nr:hypothetical protein TNCV_4318371 [Trichonephila clavipes]
MDVGLTDITEDTGVNVVGSKVNDADPSKIHHWLIHSVCCGNGGIFTKTLFLLKDKYSSVAQRNCCPFLPFYSPCADSESFA